MIKYSISSSIGISPEPKGPRQALEIIDRLQTRTAPNIFQPNGVYDGKNNLYVSHLLKFQGNSETVIYIPITPCTHLTFY